MNTRRGNKMSFFNVGIFLFTILNIVVIGVGDVNAEVAGHLLINEVQTDSVVGAGGSSDDFIEIFNPTDQVVVLDGWSIQKHAASASSTIHRKALSGSIEPQGYYLIVRGDTDTSQSLKNMADILTSSVFSLSSNNTVYLVNNDENIDSASDENIVDYLGFGTAEIFETAAMVNPPETKSIGRTNSVDTDDNLLDFQVFEIPSPTNTSTSSSDEVIAAVVLITVTKSLEDVQNISTNSAEIVFSVNTIAKTRVKYGLSDIYTSVSVDEQVATNTETRISLDSLACDTRYHFTIEAETVDGAESHHLSDASFKTLPCGISLDSLTMTQSSARANDSYSDGWSWNFEITIWDLSETGLKMKFDVWTGETQLDAGGNMQYSVNGLDWHDITTNDSYGVESINIGEVDTDMTSTGRQVSIIVRMKLPIGTLAGGYTSSYGILTE